MSPPSLVPAQEDYGRRPAVESPRLCWYPGAESYGRILQGGKDAPAHCCCSAGQAEGLAYKTGLQYTCPRVPCKLVAVSGTGSQYRVTVVPEWASPVPLHSGKTHTGPPVLTRSSSLLGSVQSSGSPKLRAKHRAPAGFRKC